MQPPDKSCQFPFQEQRPVLAILSHSISGMHDSILSTGEMEDSSIWRCMSVSPGGWKERKEIRTKAKWFGFSWGNKLLCLCLLFHLQNQVNGAYLPSERKTTILQRRLTLQRACKEVGRSTLFPCTIWLIQSKAYQVNYWRWEDEGCLPLSHFSSYKGKGFWFYCSCCSCSFCFLFCMEQSIWKGSYMCRPTKHHKVCTDLSQKPVTTPSANI